MYYVKEWIEARTTNSGRSLPTELYADYFEYIKQHGHPGQLFWISAKGLSQHLQKLGINRKRTSKGRFFVDFALKRVESLRDAESAI